MADTLELHQTTLDLTDVHARAEHDAYGKLTTEFRSIAARLRAVAAQMAGYRDLPMGRHDEQAMSDLKAMDVFAKFVKIEQDLLVMLQKAVRRDEEMLVEMRDQQVL